MNIISVATITLLGVTWAAAGMAAERIPLTLSAAVARATSAHPALRAAQLQVEIAGGQRDASALAPVTTVGLEVENFAGHGSVSGFDAAETTLSIAGKFERGDKSKLRRTAGERRVDLARLGELSIRLEVEAATEQLFTVHWRPSTARKMPPQQWRRANNCWPLCSGGLKLAAHHWRKTIPPLSA